MKKIKISQLPLYSSLKGLFTIGVDANNRSVKVSLEFIEDETHKAVQDAEAATEAARQAKTETETATRNAQTATTNANTATTNARSATTAAQTATTNANNAATKANTAAENATTTATQTAAAAKKVADDAAAAAKKTAEDAAKKATDAATDALTAKDNAEKATAEAEKATDNAEAATEAAQYATTQTIAALAKLIPTGLKVSSIERITLGNVADNVIEATLQPDGTMPNIIFISDNKAVRIDQTGHIRVIGLGASEVQIIPTCNTALAKTIIIRVESPTLRFVNTRKKLRITESGAILLN